MSTTVADRVRLLGLERESPSDEAVTAAPIGPPRLAEPRRLRAVGPGRAEPLVPAVEAANTALSAAEHLALGRTPEVLAEDPWAEAGRKVLRFHLSRMLARVPGTIAGEDPEEVHAMRVASRRV